MKRISTIARVAGRACAMAAVVAIGTASLGAQAQVQSQPATAETAAAPLTEVVVTGSRIAQTQLQSVSPVSVVQSEAIQQRGTTNIEDMLNQLPSITPDQSSGLSQGSTGVANINLRDLGSQRTLVLINGRRLMPGDPTINGNGAADVNNIPTALVKRVEVLTGSASATYGADAVAGVVNFIMDDHFQGVQLDADIGTFQHHNQQTAFFNGLLEDAGFAPTAASGTHTDGDSKAFNLMMGSDFADGKGNIVGYLTYKQQNPIQGYARDFNACTVASEGGYACSGSGTTSPPVIFGTDGGAYQLSPDYSSFTDIYNLYNYGPTHFFQRQDERYNGGFYAHYNINDKVQAYSELMFMHDSTRSQYAPTGVFAGSGLAPDPTFGTPDGNYLVNCGAGFGSPGANPFLNATTYTQVCDPASPLVSSQSVVNGNTLSQVTLGLRNTTGGDRVDQYVHTSYRFVGGAKGDITDAISFDVYAMQGVTEYQTTHLNDLSVQRVTNALQAVVDPVTGNTVCLANVGQAGAPGCVPYNIWQVNGISQAALGYVQVPAFESGQTQESVVSGNVTFDLGKYGIRLPTATDGISANVGAEWRREKLVLNVDQSYIDGDVAGSGIVLPTAGSYSVGEEFVEFRAPLVQDKPFMKALTLDGGYRFSDYSLGFSTNTYKLGLQWAPLDDIRFRGSFQRAVRAPNIQELYSTNYVGLDGSGDPCAGPAPDATPEECAHSGVTAAQYGNIASNPAAQYNGQQGGNPHLLPETAKTTSFGIVLTPTMLPGFSATFDYFKIDVANLISTYGADFTLNQCVATGAAQYCSLVHRGGNGTLWLSPTGYIVDTNVNTGAEKTSGVDVDINYRLDMGAIGSLHADLTGTYVKNFVFSPALGSSYDCAAAFGPTCGPPLPSWRHNLSLDYQTPIKALSANVTWRFVGRTKAEFTEPALASENDLAGLADARIGSFSYVDMSAAYTWSKLTFRVGVNNLFDKDPPLIGADEIGNGLFGENNTYPQIYDTLGRFLHASVSAKF